MGLGMNTEKFLHEIEASEYLTHHTAQLKAVMKPSLRLRTQPLEGEPTIGESRIGGLPDLSKETIWPTCEGVPLMFLAQINLGDIASYEISSVLPREGILSFFALDPHSDITPFTAIGSGVIEEKKTCEVIYSLENSLERRDAPGDITLLEQCSILISREDTFPPIESAMYESLSLEAEAASALLEVVEGVYMDDETIHRMFGYPNQVQGDLYALAQRYFDKAWEDPNWETLAERGKDLILLFQIDSDENTGIMWGDGGTLYFFVKPEDLVKRDFSDVWSEWQSC